MDNPHTLEIDLSYLAAMIDGEGCVTLERTGRRRKGNGEMGLSPKIIVTNTNLTIIGHVVNLFKRVGVTPHIKSSMSGRRNKACYWVTVQGLTKVKVVLDVVMPYLVGKVAQAKLLLDFISCRGDLPKGLKYGPVEMGILDKIRALNFRGVPTTEDYELAHYNYVK